MVCRPASPYISQYPKPTSAEDSNSCATIKPGLALLISARDLVPDEPLVSVAVPEVTVAEVEDVELDCTPFTSAATSNTAPLGTS